MATAALSIRTRGPWRPELSRPHAAENVKCHTLRVAERSVRACAGRYRGTVNSPAARRRTAYATTALDPADSARRHADLQLDADDQRAFRRWFTFLAETQCAAGRGASARSSVRRVDSRYREALRAHDGRWACCASAARPGSLVAKISTRSPLGADLLHSARSFAPEICRPAPSRSSPTGRCNCETPIS